MAGLQSDDPEITDYQLRARHRSGPRHHQRSDRFAALGLVVRADDSRMHVGDLNLDCMSIGRVEGEKCYAFFTEIRRIAGACRRPGGPLTAVISTTLALALRP